MVAVLLALLTLFSYVTYRDILSERGTAEIDNALVISRTAAVEVESFVRGLEDTVLAIASAVGLQHAPLDQSKTGAYLRTVFDDYELLRALFLIDVNGRVISTATGEGIGRDLSQRPYVQALRAGARSVWSDGLVGIQSGEITIAHGRAVTGSDGNPRGYLIAAFYPARVVERLQGAIPQDARITVIDRRGFVLATTLPSTLSLKQRDLSASPPVRDALAGRAVRVPATTSLLTTDVRYGALAPVNGVGWVIGFTRPLAPLEANLRGVVFRESAAEFVATLLALLIFMVFARRLTRPLGTLAVTADAIARGERPAVPRIQGPREVEQLSAGMRTMSEAVAAREDALAFLAEASRVLAGSLDYHATLVSVARLAVPHFSDWCAVDVVDEGGTVQRVAVTHVDPTKVDLAYELQRRYPTDPNSPRGVPNVLRTGRPEILPEIPDALLEAAAHDAEHLQLIRGLGLKSAMIVPLISRRQQVLGAITFVSAESGRRFGQADLTLTEGLARSAATAIENARLYERERGIAETLQRSLLPKTLPEIPGAAVATRYLPAKAEVEVGGDWYDVFVLQDGRVGLVMGDVAGRGIRAASVMGQLQNSLRAYALEGYTPAAVMERLNRILDPSEMATLCYLQFDPATWTIQYANAGHPPPLVISPEGSAVFLENGAPPVGGMALVTYRNEIASLSPGSTIILYTDGLVEVRGESIDDGLARLVRAVEEWPGGNLDGLLDRILKGLLGGESAIDDVALVALRASRLDPAHLKLRLPAAPYSVPILRQTLSRWLTQSQATTEDVFDISVACAEACANAIEHAYRAADATVEVEATLADRDVTITVRDWGHWRAPRGTDRGRGMTLIRGLMDEVQVVPGTNGTTVQMRRRLRGEIRA